MAEDLPALWNAESTTVEMRKQVLSTVIEEVMCDVDDDNALVLLDIHWIGGVYTCLSVKKNRPGEHRHGTHTSTEDLARLLSAQLADKGVPPLDHVGCRLIATSSLITRFLHFQLLAVVENGGPSLDGVGCRLLQHPL